MPVDDIAPVDMITSSESYIIHTSGLDTYHIKGSAFIMSRDLL